MLGEDYPPRTVNYVEPTWPAIFQGLAALAVFGLPWVIILAIGKAIYVSLTGS